MLHLDQMGGVFCSSFNSTDRSAYRGRWAATQQLLGYNLEWTGPFIACTVVEDSIPPLLFHTPHLQLNVFIDSTSSNMLQRSYFLSPASARSFSDFVNMLLLLYLLLICAPVISCGTNFLIFFWPTVNTMYGSSQHPVCHFQAVRKLK